MINLIWVLLLAGGIVVAGLNGRIDRITPSAIAAAEMAVNLSFKLMGVMCLWLGIMKIAEAAGIIRLFARLLGPVIRLVFPSVPRQHPAIGAIVMTVSANLLGLGNAVTPLGIKAMQELQTLNRERETASEAMCTLLALCTTGFTLIPATVIALRAAAGSVAPAEIVGATWLVSFMATATVLTLDRICRRLFGARSRR
ncbi:MAG TPA: nucleoside recognition domain-containing protein [Selenomonadales bacterium]|nr:nucleoside recognition domain-containing protein [Selenomonadales bacterium]